MKIGVIGDDFTGSGDIANTLARASARTVLNVGIPIDTVSSQVDAVVVALKSRSIAPADAVAQSLAACRWLLANGAEQIVFKYCSTFDSTPEGNIGPVAETLLDELNAPLALVCPAFPANGRTVYQGHLFVGDRLLNESGMERHPLTPMTDPDIRRWLARQTRLKIGHLPLAVLRSGQTASALNEAERRGERLIVADAVDEADLLALGRLAKAHRLVTGGSAVASGLPANFGISADSCAPKTFAGADGPALVLSGSCSRATRRQLAAYCETHPVLKISAEEALDANAAIERACAFLDQRRGEEPVIYSTADPAEVAAAQERFGREILAAQLDLIFAGIARRAVAAGFRRFVVAGGETSGAVTSALGPLAFSVGPEIDPGVPALLAEGELCLAVALKSGNFGSADFFQKATTALQGTS